MFVRAARTIIPCFAAAVTFGTSALAGAASGYGDKDIPYLLSRLSSDHMEDDMQGPLWAAPFESDATLVTFQGPSDKPVGAISVVTGSHHPVMCFYDHDDKRLATMKPGAAVHVAGRIATNMSGTLTLAANCSITAR